MAELRHLLSQDSKLALEAVRYMSPDPEVVTDMTREQLGIHLDIRAKVLAAQSNDWREPFEAEMNDKISLWSAARDLHEIMKHSRGSKDLDKIRSASSTRIKRKHDRIVERHRDYEH